MRIILCLGILLSTGFASAETESIKLVTKRGVEVEGVIHYPETKSPIPVVVIAPGQGYHMDLPLTEGLAKKIAEQGSAAIRFNWNYYSNKSQPSADLSHEAEDLATIVQFAKINPRFESEKIVIAGKSLGSVVAHQVFQSDAELKALILMTPVCTSNWDENGNRLPTPVPSGPENYPGLQETTRPVVIALGSKDLLCSLPMLYDFLGKSTTSIPTVVLGGDHSLNIGPWDDPAFEARNAENINMANEMITHWIDLILKGH